MPSSDYEQDTTVRNAPLRIKARGRGVLANPMTNRGTAFTESERRQLGLLGLLPTGVTSLENQTTRVYEQFRRTTTPLGKYLGLAGLRDRNEVLFHHLLSEHLEEMLPIIYTPTIGEAIERFSHEYNRPRGVYLSIDHPEDMEEALLNYGLRSDEVDLLVVTDSEGILGIGDQGIGGIQIAIGKLSVYTAAAGIHPRRVIPVVLDVGTDNLGLLNTNLYLGERHARVRGPAYDAFIDQFVHTSSRLFPQAMIHWEDFGAPNAHPILERYRHDFCTFNDDIQGTAAVVLAAILAGVDVTGIDLAEHRFVIFGAGSAGVGIANLVRDTMLRQNPGLTLAEAQSRFWALGRQGLFVEDDPSLMDFQRPYARPRADVVGWEAANGTHLTLTDVIREVRPTVLIGTSTKGGAFTAEIVTEMARHATRPIIMPLSNPTSRAEATPEDLLKWTDGKALVATGSPFDPVDHGGVRHTIAQSNNALIFPGLGLGVAACSATRVTESMIAAAAEALAGLVNAYRPGAALLPSISQLRMVSATVAVAVAQAAAADGVARNPLTDPIQQIYSRMWQPIYPPIEIAAPEPPC
ncbi:MAG: NAD-dependent malic enzyme [Nocardioides sp.]